MLSIFQKIDKIRPVYDWVYNTVLTICKLLLVIDILITGYVVISRYIPWIPGASWSEEVVLSCMAYMTVLAAALAIRRGAHIRMTAFDRVLPKSVVKASDLLADVAVFILAVVMITVGWKYASGIGSKGTYVSMPFLSRFWMYFPVPLAGVAMIVFQIESIYTHIKSFFVEEKEATE